MSCLLSTSSAVFILVLLAEGVDKDRPHVFTPDNMCLLGNGKGITLAVVYAP